MKIVLAPDSFKGSLTALEAVETMEKAILDVDPTHSVIMKPMADGGEGTIDAMLASTKGENVSVSCTGPLGERIESSYVILESNQAVIELAAIAGLVQVPLDKRNPDYTTTYGLGEVIRDALDRGCTSIVIGLGGSATNDGGLGMLLSLGGKAWDENGDMLKGFGIDLHHVSKISLSEIDTRIRDVEIKVACDVNNPLCGKSGASVVFGPQKGMGPDQIKPYDQALARYGSLIETEIGILKDTPGAGAAGGVGFATLAIGAELVSGATLIANSMQLEVDIQEADLVITGEGQSDEQTLYGKAPGHVADLSKKYGVPVVLLSGSLVGDIDVLREKFAGCFSIVNRPMALEECMKEAEILLYEQTKQIIHFTKSF